MLDGLSLKYTGENQLLETCILLKIISWYLLSTSTYTYRLMMAGSMPTSSGLSSQQALDFKFFTVLVAHSYRVWNMYAHKCNIFFKLKRVRAGQSTAAETRSLTMQMLRMEPFHTFVDNVRIHILDMVDNHVHFDYTLNFPGVRSSEKRQIAPKRQRRISSNYSSNYPNVTAIRLCKTLRHN